MDSRSDRTNQTSDTSYVSPSRVPPPLSFVAFAMAKLGRKTITATCVVVHISGAQSFEPSTARSGHEFNPRFSVTPPARRFGNSASPRSKVDRRLLRLITASASPHFDVRSADRDRHRKAGSPFALSRA